MSLSEIDLFREYALSESDIELGEPATEQEIAAFEMKYGIKFPADVREYFLKINGLYMSGDFISLEPLNEWRLATEIDYSSDFREMLPEDADQYFRFGNYDRLVWDWLIKLNVNPAAETPVVVFLWNAVTKEQTRIAENFTDFLQKFRISDPGSLLR